MNSDDKLLNCIMGVVSTHCGSGYIEFYEWTNEISRMIDE